MLALALVPAALPLISVLGWGLDLGLDLAVSSSAAEDAPAGSTKVGLAAACLFFTDIGFEPARAVAATGATGATAALGFFAACRRGRVEAAVLTTVIVLARLNVLSGYG